jgi:uncharacterized protein (DUF608 family)
MSKASFFTHDQLYGRRERLTYCGDQLREIAFPLGGIGTGCVSLSGRGALVDWEVFNRPNKGMILPYTFFMIWAQSGDGAPVARVVQAPPQPPFSGSGSTRFGGLGFGVQRGDGSGFPHMRSATFTGEFPFAEVAFSDPVLPVEVMLEAYSPFIPLNADESGLPIAVLRYHLHNPGTKPVQISLAGSITNPVGYSGTGELSAHFGDKAGLGQNLNRYVVQEGLRSLSLTSEQIGADDPRFGSLALSTTWSEGFCQESWLRGGWYDMMHDFWDHYAVSGTLPERSYGPSPEGHSDVGTLGAQLTLGPGESAVVPFLITWYFPTFSKYWGDIACSCDSCERPTWRNYYASQWQDALDVARYYAQHGERLYTETRRFHQALFASTLPASVLDAVSSQASILHSPTVLRLEDGTFYGFEGCHCDSGCCEGTCTHVWNYAQTAALLFPSLERSLRDADYQYNLEENGHMGFRLQLPIGSPPWQFHAAADGQMGGILKVYRDWKLCGDEAWLRGLWPKVKKALEYAWVQWDENRDGVMEGIQHNTYDIEFHGPNTMMGTFYLGALRAAEEMARYLGDTAAADQYRQVFERGKARTERELWNGEFYVQHVESDEEDPKYQYGAGCLSDHMIGQWFAHVVGLGYLLEPEHVRSATSAIFEHNWLTDFWEHSNPQRIYALNDEQGLLLCSWPKGGRPEFPFVYSDEVWCGIEYQVASHLIYEGFVDQGLAIVKGLRDRHDGVRRNPWNEFECGSHYARSLASWSLLTALSGFNFDLPYGAIGFAPRLWADDFQCFWSTGTGWGQFSQRIAGDGVEVTLSVLSGTLPLRQLELGALPKMPTEATVGGRAVALQADTRAVTLSETLTLEAGQTLRLR